MEMYLYEGEREQQERHQQYEPVLLESRDYLDTCARVREESRND